MYVYGFLGSENSREDIERMSNNTYCLNALLSSSVVIWKSCIKTMM